MKHLLIAACCALVPVAAEAQNCCFGSYTISTCQLTGSSCDSAPSFTTTHKWTVTAPGIMSLSGTTFAITFDAMKVEYNLTWGTKQIGSSASLSEMEALGVKRAQDMQDAGLPLK